MTKKSVEEELQDVIAGSPEAPVDSAKVLDQYYTHTADYGKTIAVEAVLVSKELSRQEKDVDGHVLEELKASILENGLMNPILIDATGQLVAGMRRLLAFKSLGINIIPCTIVSRETADSLRMGIVENIQREGLTKIQEAQAYEHLLTKYKKKYPSQKALAKALGISESKVSQALGHIDVQKKYPAAQEKKKAKAAKKEEKKAAVEVEAALLPVGVRAVVFKDKIVVGIEIDLKATLEINLAEKLKEKVSAIKEDIMTEIKAIHGVL